MLPNQENQPNKNNVVVELQDSSSDEDCEIQRNKTKTTPQQQNPRHNSMTQQTSSSSSSALESRSFWKAGLYVAGPTTSNLSSYGDLEHARVHPKFLHSNATSHKWAFGAMAELLDNAVDEIHNGATYVKVDKVDIMKDGSPALLIQDDGGGMSPEGIRKCMSLGYSSKKTNTTIGLYGNGFKTSTMRLGGDAIVFTRATQNGQATQSIGLLSYTFLRTTGQDDVIVPMIDFDISGHLMEPIIYSSNVDWSENLKTILEWTPFTSKEELLQQFEDIGKHGTKVIIYNLWLNDEGIYELSFDDDEEDIRLRDETDSGSGTRITKRVAELRSHISYRLRYSLRAYASLLYLRKFKNFNIILRGKPVEQFNVVDDLKYSKVVTYRPQLSMPSNEVVVETTLGFIKEAPSLNVSGFNVYHKNRLIRPFWKVTADGSSKGNGVVGVLEANFIEPAHDKQDFERSSLFVRLENKLKQFVMDYWKSACHLVGYQPLDAKLLSMYKNRTNQPCTGANIQEKSCPTQPVGLNANVRMDTRNVQPSGGYRTNNPLNPQPDKPNLALENLSSNEVTLVDGLESKSIDQICEENIQLFMRCEEHRKKEADLKQTVGKLESELAEAKRKHAQLNAYIENRKKQQALRIAKGI